MYVTANESVHQPYQRRPMHSVNTTSLFTVFGLTSCWRKGKLQLKNKAVQLARLDSLFRKAFRRAFFFKHFPWKSSSATDKNISSNY